MDHADQKLLPTDLHLGEPRFLQKVAGGPDKGFPIFLEVAEYLTGKLPQGFPFLVTNQLVDDELALIGQEQSGIYGGPVRMLLQ